MGQRQANHRRVKIHRSYTVEEIARLFDIHKNTVRAWVKAGLPTSDQKRPTLILGRELVAFLRSRCTSRKRPCRPGEIYCFKCRLSQKPAGNLVDYEPVTEKIGNVKAICPDCESIMNQRVNLDRLRAFQNRADVKFPKALLRINGCFEASLNSDLR
jgi:hypothetical protein